MNWCCGHQRHRLPWPFWTFLMFHAKNYGVVIMHRHNPDKAAIVESHLQPHYHYFRWGISIHTQKSMLQSANTAVWYVQPYCSTVFIIPHLRKPTTSWSLHMFCNLPLSLQIIPPGNQHQMALQEMSLQSTGRYSCQVTLDAPPFLFVAKSGHMTVISLPERFPVISGIPKLKPHFNIGDKVDINCSCHNTYPPANLQWFINDKKVSG